MAKKSRLSTDTLSAVAGAVSEGNTQAPTEVKDGEARTGGASTVEALQRRPVTQRSTPTVHIDTSICRMWKYADRIDEGLDDESLEELAESIRKHEQRVPVIARQIDDPQYKYEIIAGRRRFEACKRAGVKVLAMVKQMNDQEAFSVMLVENDDRKDITPWSRAISLRASIEAGIYNTQAELINAHNETSAHKKYKKAFVSKMLTATKLVDIDYVWRHIKHPSTIPVIPACDLVKALEDKKAGAANAKAVQTRISRLASHDRLEQMTGGELVTDLVATLKSGARPPAKTAEVSSGNLRATGVVRGDKLKVEIEGPAGGFPEGDGAQLISQLLKKLNLT